jgi:preprotein translocase subunit SecG
MFVFVIILIVLVSLLLTLVVLVQNPKGGGVNSQFVGNTGNQIGVRQTNDLVTKITWYLGIGLFVLVLSTNFLVDKKGGVDLSSPNIKKAQGTRLPSSNTAPAKEEKKEQKK